MLTKVRFFMKGVHFTTDIFFIVLVWALVEKNQRIENELEDIKNNSYYGKKTSYSSYKTSHHPKGKPVPTQKAKYPIGFATTYPTDEESEKTCD